MKEIADTGPIVALLTCNDPHHQWALHAFRNHGPFYTCDAVLAEAASFFPDPVGLLRLVSRGDLRIDPDFCLARESRRRRAAFSFQISAFQEREKGMK